MHLEVTVKDDGSYGCEFLEHLSKLAKAEYRRVSGSDRLAFIFRWNIQSWTSDGARSTYTASLIGAYQRKGKRSPVLADVTACVEYVGYEMEEQA